MGWALRLCEVSFAAVCRRLFDDLLVETMFRVVGLLRVRTHERPPAEVLRPAARFSRFVSPEATEQC